MPQRTLLSGAAEATRSSTLAELSFLSGGSAQNVPQQLVAGCGKTSRLMDNTPSADKEEPAGAITRLTSELQTAQQHNDRPLCQEILSNAVLAFETDPEALDRTLFDVFGTVVHCASSECCNLVQRYLQLVSDHCSSREVMTLLMSSLDNISGQACLPKSVQAVIAINNSSLAIQVCLAR